MFVLFHISVDEGFGVLSFNLSHLFMSHIPAEMLFASCIPNSPTFYFLIEDAHRETVSVKGQGWESQNPPGVESAEECEVQHERFLQVFQQRKETRGNVSLWWKWSKVHGDRPGGQCCLHLCL